jgi:hypothetical protein
MVAWADYRKEARERGALALELFVAVSTPAKTPQEVRAALDDHLAYQQQLERDGALAFAGPLSDMTGEQMEGAGMIIYRAAGWQAAQALAEADPMHASGARSFILRRWLINEGSLHLSVGLSTRTVEMDQP